MNQRNRENIVLTWMPWSWKSTIWYRVAYLIWYEHCDFDDDILEKITNQVAEEVIWVLRLRSNWITPEKIAHQEVKDLLELLGEKDFLELEWYMWEQLIFNAPTILSTSGSLPLKLKAMDHLKESWKVVYIDTPVEEILKRLEIMKTDRIIWMWKMTLEEILNYRKEFYDKTKDYNFIPPKVDDDIEIRNQQGIITNAFIDFMKKNKIWK